MERHSSVQSTLIPYNSVSVVQKEMNAHDVVTGEIMENVVHLSGECTIAFAAFESTC